MMNNGRHFKAVDFNEKLFGGWDPFSRFMHDYYVGKPWFFGYKCPDCQMDDYSIFGNIQDAAAKCPKCGRQVVSFFEANRTKRYFSQRGFRGRVAFVNETEMYGWILGFEEKLSDYNKVLPDQTALCMSYVCIMPRFRRGMQKPEKLRTAIYMLNKRIPFLGLLLLMTGEPYLKTFHYDFEDYAKAHDYKALSCKMPDEPVLESLAGAAGFQKAAAWEKNPGKHIWVKHI